MVNNEFHLIGVATSNFQNISNGKFISHIVRVEVEKFGSKTGNVFELDIQVYGTNKAIDTSTELLGEQIAINGYLDSYTTKDGNVITKLVAQNLYVLGSARKHNARSSAIAPQSAIPHPSAIPDDLPTDIQSDDSGLDNVEVSDDDLPF